MAGTSSAWPPPPPSSPTSTRSTTSWRPAGSSCWRIWTDSSGCGPQRARASAEAGAVRDLLRFAGVREGDLALHHDARAERPVALHGQAGRVQERGRTGGEAMLELVDRPVARTKGHHGRGLALHRELSIRVQ